MTRVLPDLIACELDALYPIEPKAMDIAAVKHESGDRLALLSNIDVDRFMVLPYNICAVRENVGDTDNTDDFYYSPWAICVQQFGCGGRPRS